jgi:hypothetical protein
MKSEFEKNHTAGSKKVLNEPIKALHARKRAMNENKKDLQKSGQLSYKKMLWDVFLVLLCCAVIGTINIVLWKLQIIPIALNPVSDLRLMEWVNIIFTIITIILALIAFGSIFSWKQLKDRKESIEEEFGNLRKRYMEDLQHIEFKAKSAEMMMTEAAGESYLSSAGLNLYLTRITEYKAISRSYIESARILCEKFQEIDPLDFRGPRLKGQISLISEDYQEAIRQLEIAKQKIADNHTDYPHFCYLLGVTYMVSCKRLRAKYMARMARDIINLLIEAFKRRPEYVDIALSDPYFKDPENLKEDEVKNPLVAKLNQLNDENKGVRDLEESDVKAWTELLRNFLKDN